MRIFRRRRLPEVEVVRLQAGDRLLIRADDFLTEDQADRIHRGVLAVYGPDFPVLVLPRGLDFAVVRDTKEPA